MSTITVWWQGARPRTLGAGLVPVVVGTAAAGHVIWWRLGAALVVAAGLQIGVNYANDYFDGVRGVDTAERVGPPRLTAGGHASARAVLTAAAIALGFAAVAGLALALVTAPVAVLAVGAVALAAAALYSGGPKPYAGARPRRADGVRVLRADGDRRHGLRDGRDDPRRRVVGRRGDGVPGGRDPGGEQPARHRHRRGGRTADAGGSARRPANATSLPGGRRGGLRDDRRRACSSGSRGLAPG